MSFKDLFKGLSGGKFIEQKIDGNAGSFYTGFPVTNRGVSDNPFINVGCHLFTLQQPENESKSPSDVSGKGEPNA